MYRKQLDIAKELINQGKTDQALTLLDKLVQVDSFPYKEQAYYLRGNTYRKRGDWQHALNNYQQAIDLNPQSPAAQARNMILDILNFYHKDMFNQ